MIDDVLAGFLCRILLYFYRFFFFRYLISKVEYALKIMSVQKKAKAKLPTHWGDFSVIAYEDEKSGEEHLLLYLGELED